MVLQRGEAIQSTKREGFLVVGATLSLLRGGKANVKTTESSLTTCKKN